MGVMTEIHAGQNKENQRRWGAQPQMTFLNVTTKAMAQEYQTEGKIYIESTKKGRDHLSKLGAWRSWEMGEGEREEGKECRKI